LSQHDTRRRHWIAAAAGAALTSLAWPSFAQNEATDAYPSRPVRWVVPFPPGGAMDNIARMLGEHLGKKLGQTFVIENKPGAGGNIGADSVAKSDADGYTMMIVANGQAVNRFLYNKLSYDPVKDFTPVSLLAVVPNVLVTQADRPTPKAVPELIASAKAQPGKWTYASAGNGTSIHLAGVLFASMAGVDMLHVPYKGSGPAIADLLGGQVDYMFDSITSARPHILSGKLKAIAVTTRTRSPALPDVPTVAEAGLAGYELAPWFAVFMPAGTPAPVVQKMNSELVAALQLPEIRDRLKVIGAEPIGSTPQELGSYLQSEMDKWGRIIRERGLRAD